MLGAVGGDCEKPQQWHISWPMSKYHHHMISYYIYIYWARSDARYPPSLMVRSRMREKHVKCVDRTFPGKKILNFKKEKRNISNPQVKTWDPGRVKIDVIRRRKGIASLTAVRVYNPVVLSKKRHCQMKVSLSTCTGSSEDVGRMRSV